MSIASLERFFFKCQRSAFENKQRYTLAWVGTAASSLQILVINGINDIGRSSFMENAAERFLVCWREFVEEYQFFWKSLPQSFVFYRKRSRIESVFPTLYLIVPFQSKFFSGIFAKIFIRLYREKNAVILRVSGEKHVIDFCLFWTL